MATYTLRMQSIVEDYRAAGEPWPATAVAMADWAIRTKRWKLPGTFAIKKCAEDLAEAMREEYITDTKGRRVRVKHAARVYKNGEQLVLWHDMRDATRDQMQVSFQQRRQQVVNDCVQLKRRFSELPSVELALTAGSALSLPMSGIADKESGSGPQDFASHRDGDRRLQET